MRRGRKDAKHMEHFVMRFVEANKAATHTAPGRLAWFNFNGVISQMKTLTALALAIALSSPMAALAASDHSHHGSEAQQLQLNAGKKWGTDAPLRQAMTAVRTSVTQILPAAHAGKAKAADYDAFGKVVDQQIAYMVENCKLPADADAQLHIIVADLMAGAEAAQGKHGEAKRAAGVVQVAQASNAYGKYFDHGGWKAVKLPH